MIWTIPNILTMGRILAAPVVVWLILGFDDRVYEWLALVVFGVAAITDFFDGWLARKLDQISEIGTMLDPIADKAMVILVLAALMARSADLPNDGTRGLHDTYMTTLITIPAFAIILREVLVSGLREFLGDVKLAVTRIAKWKTTMQLLAIGLLLAAIPVGPIFGPGSKVSVLQSLMEPPVILEPGYPELHAILILAGLALLWIAALLTLISGWDYFRKGIAYIRQQEQDREVF